MSGKNQFVVKHGDDWALRGAGNKKATAVFDTQAEAIAAGITVAKNQQSELIIQGRNGQFRSKDSYGNDPFPPKDTEN